MRHIPNISKLTFPTHKATVSLKVVFSQLVSTKSFNDQASWKNLKAVDQICKKLYHRCLTDKQVSVYCNYSTLIPDHFYNNSEQYVKEYLSKRP